MTKPMKKLPQESWEKRVLFQSGHLYIDGTWASTNKRQLRKLIHQILTSDRQRVVEEIGGKVDKLEEDSSTLYGCGYNEGVKDVTDIILQIKKEIEV